MKPLSEMNVHELADETRRREAEYREGLAELDRRNALSSKPWSEERTAAWLQRRKTDPEWGEDWRAAARENSSVEDLPPPLFRMGYEWAALSLMMILETVLSRHSEDITELWEVTDIGRGLCKIGDRKKVWDARRRGAFDLVQSLTSFVNTRLVALYTAHPINSKSKFVPSDHDFKDVYG